MFPNMKLENQIDGVLELLNKGEKRKRTKGVSFSHIPDFISGVMVHPLAPDWYVEIVRDFCDRNHIAFEGKSKLYLV